MNTGRNDSAVGAIRIRALDPGEAAEVELVAARMRHTLEEVLGEAEGRALYTMEWLKQRVLWHLDAAQCTGQVFLAEQRAGTIVGHTIVRIERDEAGNEFGLFSTTFVAPEARQRGVAAQLLQHGEQWMAARGMTEAVTYTAAANTRLQRLYLKKGYALAPAENGFVRLAKALQPFIANADRIATGR